MPKDPKSIDANDVLAVLQQRFPREYEICVQQVYISNLESSLPQQNDEEVGN